MNNLTLDQIIKKNAKPINHNGVPANTETQLLAKICEKTLHFIYEANRLDDEDARQYCQNVQSEAEKTLDAIKLLMKDFNKQGD